MTMRYDKSQVGLPRHDVSSKQTATFGPAPVWARMIAQWPLMLIAVGLLLTLAWTGTLAWSMVALLIRWL